MFSDRCIPEVLGGSFCEGVGKRHKATRLGYAESPKKSKENVPSDLMKIFRIVSKRRNPYDPFPEEQRNYTLDEMMEILCRLGHIWR